EQILDDIVNESPHAVIEASPREGSAPLDVNFNAQYSRDDGTITEYRWNFGDPMSTMSAMEQATSHRFTNPGTYLVKLTVVDDEGAVDTQQVAIVVTDSPPIAQASVSNENPLPGTAVIFSATGSYDLQGEIVSYQWDFGDGKTGTGQTSQHTYTQGGYYVCTLMVTDESGATTRTNLGINVLPGQSNSGGSSTCGDIKPLAIITSKYFSCTSNGKVGDNITLDGVASRPAVGSIVSYHWEFGDGSTGSGPTVSHVYSTPYTYIITLTIVDEGGGTSKATGSISIGGAACE
ncbi:PKD domain-containing protein, partial [Candidatus Bipolaricaulota bacterium]